MTDLTPAQQAAQDSARDKSNGQFGVQAQSAAEVTIISAPDSSLRDAIDQSAALHTRRRNIIDQIETVAGNVLATMIRERFPDATVLGLYDTMDEALGDAGDPFYAPGNLQDADGNILIDFEEDDERELYENLYSFTPDIKNHRSFDPATSNLNLTGLGLPSTAAERLAAAAETAKAERQAAEAADKAYQFALGEATEELVLKNWPGASAVRFYVDSENTDFAPTVEAILDSNGEEIWVYRYTERSPEGFDELTRQFARTDSEGRLLEFDEDHSERYNFELGTWRTSF